MNELSKLALGGSMTLGLLAGPLSNTPAVAQTAIETYEFSGQPGDEVAVAPGTVSNGLGGELFSRALGLTADTGASSISTQGVTAAQDPTGLLYSFGLTVDPGDTATVSAVSLGYRSSATGPGSILLEDSVDGSAFSVVTTLTTNSTNFISAVVPVSLTDITSNVQFELLTANQLSTTGAALGSAGTIRVGDFSPTVASSPTTSAPSPTKPVTITGTVSGPVTTAGTIPTVPTTTPSSAPQLLQFSGSGTWGAGTQLTTYSAPGESYSFSFDLESPTEANPSAEVTDFTFFLDGVDVASAADTPFITFADLADDGLFDLFFPDSGVDLTLEGGQVGSDQGGTDTSGDPVTITPGDYPFQITDDFPGTPTGTGNLTVEPVPEPASMALFSGGVLMLGRIRRRAARATPA